MAARTNRPLGRRLQARMMRVINVLQHLLAAAGLLRRAPAEDDGRGLDAVLTDAGEDLLRRMWPVYARVLRETFVEPISADEAAAIAAGLHRATAAASATPQPLSG